jgi:hypothetical protein
MLPTYLLSKEIQEFITQNINANISKLALQKNPFNNTNWVEIINQISSKNKAKEKLPTWFNGETCIYPSKISLEQTSSEITANYKSLLVSGGNLIDLTGGFGVDDYYFAKKVDQVIHCEINPELSAIAQHNFEVLKQDNIKCIAGDGLKILKNINQKFDYIYIDPSRRNNAKGKVFMLKDCLPDVPNNIDNYLMFSNKIILKTAPILDISAALLELKNVKAIHIIAINNEVKELIWEIEKNYVDDILIKTINFSKSKEEVFQFFLKAKSQTIPYSNPKKYVYEPNAAILKSGAFHLITSHYNVEKLHQHSHLYTNNEVIDFPGRIFKVENYFEYSKKEMKLFLENKKANITTRNFPQTVEEIRNKWNIKDGGDLYCFFTINKNNNKIVLICTKIQ